MLLFIKHLSNVQNKVILESNLNDLGVQFLVVNRGEVDVVGELTMEQKSRLQASLFKSGLELIDDKKLILIEKIKNVIINLIYQVDTLPKIKNSNYIENQLNLDYTYLANIYAEKMGSTIENFIITQKIERVKEMLVFNELNITEIAYKLNYSSVAHLSAQFKKMTGLTPSSFKNLTKPTLSSI